MASPIIVVKESGGGAARSPKKSKKKKGESPGSPPGLLTVQVCWVDMKGKKKVLDEHVFRSINFTMGKPLKHKGKALERSQDGFEFEAQGIPEP